jgi:hypothetical protein
MSLELYAFLDALPDRQSWQAAINETGVDLQLDPDLDLGHDEGFSPCLIQAQPSGFELQVMPAAEVLRDHPPLVQPVGLRLHAVCFRWGGDLAECACVLGANLALLRKFDAVVYDPADGRFPDANTLETKLRECVAAL